MVDRLVAATRAYLLLAAMWIRATMAYRATFAMLTIGQFFITGADFAAILIMFSHIDRLGGFSLAEIALFYGLSSIALGMADLLMGNTELLGRRIRDGSLDAMLTRPVPALVQVAADQFALRRLGRITQALVVLGWALIALDLAWTWGKVVLLVVTILSGTAIFCAVFVLGAAYQFLAQDAAEVMNAFTYGGNTLTQYPLTIYPAAIVRGVTFIVPLAFINWYPGLRLLDRPDPFGMPVALQYASPLVAAVMCALAAVAWRAGIRRYRSTGS